MPAEQGMNPPNRDDWVADLQAQIDRELERVYSPRVLELWKNPQNAGSLDDADGHASVTGPCGDTMQIWLRVRDCGVAEARFWTDGCGPSIVCGSMVTVLAKGRSLVQAAAIDQEAVLEALGGLPEESRHCARLAAKTLRAAIESTRTGTDAAKEKQ